jgi:hypothetical protein
MRPCQRAPRTRTRTRRWLASPLPPRPLNGSYRATISDRSAAGYGLDDGDPAPGQHKPRHPSGQGRSPICTQPPVATRCIRHAQPSSRGAPCPPFRRSSASRSGISSPRSCPNRKLPTHSAATAPHPRPGRLRQAPPSARVRLRLPAHRRRYLLSHHHPPPRRMGRRPAHACGRRGGAGSRDEAALASHGRGHRPDHRHAPILVTRCSVR